MRDARSAWLTTAALVAAVALSGCGGHADAPSSEPHSGATTAAPPPPLKVVSVTPRHLKSTSAITVTYSTPLSTTSPLPTLKPALPGVWARLGSTAVFTPTQPYPPDVPFTVRAAKRAGGTSKPVANRTTPKGSLLRAEQILARLHYLPLTTTAATPTTTADEAAAVYNPPKGQFAWRFSNIPTTIMNDWTPGQSGQVMRGAIIAFQHQEHLPVDALIGKDTWSALIKADLADDKDKLKYSFVSADLNLPQQLSVWVDGQTVLTSPVNGGVPGAPTPLGTYPVYERFTSTTMSGTNPDGSQYSDPGVPWVNYFSGGSAVHGFPRASYGSPQSVGCLELPIATAKQVYGLIDYGTLVNVAGPPRWRPARSRHRRPVRTRPSTTEPASRTRADRLEHRRELVRWQRPREEEALRPFAAERAQRLALQLVLDALGDGLHLQRRGQLDDRAHQRGRLRALAQRRDEAAVDLEDVDRVAVEVGQRRVAGAEVVDRDLHAERTQRSRAATSPARCP